MQATYHAGQSLMYKGRRNQDKAQLAKAKAKHELSGSTRTLFVGMAGVTGALSCRMCSAAVFRQCQTTKRLLHTMWTEPVGQGGAPAERLRSHLCRHRNRPPRWPA